MANPGKEFMGRVSALMKKHNVAIQRSESGNNRAQTFVEGSNRKLSEKLFSHQYVQEMISDDRPREWVKFLPSVLKSINSKELDQEKKVKEVAHKRPAGLDEKRLPPEVKV